MILSDKNLKKLITEALVIEAEDAQETGEVGFMARALVQATMPHKKPQSNEFKRSNGIYTITMLASSDIGLPYGSIPRLILAWLTTEAVRTKERELILGNSMSDFMRQLSLVPVGGKWGSIAQLKSQAYRLFSCSIHCNNLSNDDNSVAQNDVILNLNVVEKAELWWKAKLPGQSSLFNSTVTLNQPFFEEIIDRPVPIDMRALHLLKKSPLAIDIYTWLTYRMSYLKQPTEILWSGLQVQFGADYPYTPQGTRNFKKKFLMQLKKVLTVYPEARAREGINGLVLLPSKTHIKPKLIK